MLGASVEIAVMPDDLSRGAHGGDRGGHAAWEIDRRVGAVAVEEAVRGDAIEVTPGDVCLVVDSIDECIDAAWGIDRRIGAATVKKAVLGEAGIGVMPDDVSLVVDSIGDRIDAAWGVDRRVGIGWCLHLPVPSMHWRRMSGVRGHC